MNRLLSIIEKNLRLLIRSKSSALIVILGPLILIFLVGIAFDNTQAYQVTIGVYSPSYNELSNSFIESLRQKQFRIEEFKNEDACVEAIKEGNVHTCMIFPEGLQIAKEGYNQITFYIDYSRINLVWSILDTVSGQVQNRSNQLSLNLTNTVLSALVQVREKAIDTKPILIDSTTKNTETKIAVYDISKNLAALDLAMNPADFKTNQIKTLSQDVQNQVKDLLTNSRTHFTSLNTSLNDAITLVRDSDNITVEDKDDITVKLYAASNSTKRLNDLIAGQDSSVTDKSDEIGTVVTELQTKISQVKTKLDKASSFRDQATKNITSVNSLLTDALNNLVVIQKNMNFIESTVDSIEVKDAGHIIAPITTQIKPVINQKTHLNYLFPSLIILVVMFICILLSSVLVIMEKNSKAYFRNFLTPTPDVLFVVATYLTTMILLAVQLIIILGTTALFFKTQIFSHIWISVVVLFLIGTTFSLIGMWIGYLFNSEETATLASILIGTLFLLISNLVLPMESMPDYIRTVARFNPYVLAEDLLRKIMLLGANIQSVNINLYLLLGYSVVIFFIIYLMQKMSKKRLLRVLFKMK
jgi:ABC-type multidrug transport system permease subunit